MAGKCKLLLALRYLLGSRINVCFSILQHLLTFLRRLIVSDVGKRTLHIFGNALHHLISISAPQSVFVLHVIAVEGCCWTYEKAYKRIYQVLTMENS